MGDAAEDRAKAAELPEGDVIRVLLEQHARIKAAEAFAPTHPHPNADPGSTKQKLVGPFASMVDRVKDALSKAV
ncbi:hypothetical protein JCM18899A_08340 [Nocardioides sp. AN3]